MTGDPFLHHPELRPLIRAPEESFFRDFDIHRFIDENPDLDLGLLAIPVEDREAGRRRLLEDRRGADLWVFAYGSLMWDPGFYFKEVRRACAPGHERRFILKDTFGGRGSPEAPGVMAALDEGTGCNGLAFLIDREVLEEETRQIWARERSGRAYCEAMIPVEIEGGTVEAVAFLADHSSPFIDTDLSREDQIAYAAAGAGFLGSSFEYVENLATHFAALGIEDAEVTDLYTAIRRRRADI